MTILHRNQIRHYHESGHCHELTFSCYRRMPLLTHDLWKEELGRSVGRAAERHSYRLVAFVFMPEHVHLLVYPLANASGVDGFLKAIKRPFSYRIKQDLLEAGSQLLQTLTVQQRPGVQTFRFWQEGPGYDRNLSSPETVLASIDYIHKNPVGRNLCQRASDWRWSSARHYESDGREVDSALPTIHGVPAEYLAGQ